MDKEKLIESVKEHEGLRLKPYRCTAGKLTIGYGRNLEDNGIKLHEAEQMLELDLAIVSNELNEALKKQPFQFGLYAKPQYVQNVLIEMAFQLGVDGLLKFKKTLKLVKDGDYKGASVEMLNSQWFKQTPQRAKNLSKIMREGF